MYGICIFGKLVSDGIRIENMHRNHFDEGDLLISPGRAFFFNDSAVCSQSIKS